MSSRNSTVPIRDKNVPYGDDEAILTAFQTDGYVVVTGVLSSNETAAMIEELWKSPRLLGQPGIKREDQDSWSEAWPQSNGGRNFLASSNLFLDATPWDLVSNPKLLLLNQLLYQRRDLRVGLSRWGVMRPTGHHPEWKTDESWLHWDQNPWYEPGFCRVQSFVCLTDSTETSGGFVCVPGFQSRFKKWGEENPEGSVHSEGGRIIDKTFGDGQPFPVPRDDPCQKEAVRVVAPAGSMVLWDSRLPHQNFPNSDDNKLRVIYYTNMTIQDESAELHRSLLEQKCVVMEALGQRGERFPHSLSSTGKQVHCLPDDFGSGSVSITSMLPPIERSKLHNAIKLVVEAGEAESEGRTADAIRLHRKSMLLFPEIEAWHQAIYA